MFVYLIHNRMTGMCYVGTTIASVRRRFREHVSCALTQHRPQALYVAIREYGAEAFTVETLHTVDTYDEMLAREIDEIAARQTLQPHGYNTVKGGRGNFGWKMRDETKRKIAAKATGRRAWNKGIPNSVEARAKMSAVRKGRPATPAQLIARSNNLRLAQDARRGRRSIPVTQRSTPTTQSKTGRRLERAGELAKIRFRQWILLSRDERAKQLAQLTQAKMVSAKTHALARHAEDGVIH